VTLPALTSRMTTPVPVVVALPHPVEASIVRRVAGPNSRELRLRQLVDQYVGYVARVLRNAGTAEADVDDDVQRVFIALANRLDDVRIGSEKSFLLQTALNMAAHARRTAARRREVLTERPPDSTDGLATPEEAVDRKQIRQLLDTILDRMDADLRLVFVLYEFEEMTMAEISTILEIPRGTVASRLRRARGEFREQVAALEGVSNPEVG
jgi:RNA polymerase sigma-70 factor, ECF subfamily